MYDRPIAFHREFVVLTGSITAALMLSQACYWSIRTDDPDGWFYKSRDEWTEETGMSRREQETARKKLRELGIIREERRGGMNPTTYFWVDTDRLPVMVKTAYENQAGFAVDGTDAEVINNLDKVDECIEKISAIEIPLKNRASTAEGGIRPQVREESAHSCGTNPTADIKESETTSEITSESDAPAAINHENNEEIGERAQIVTDCFQRFYELHFGKKPPWSKADFVLVHRQIKRVGNVMEVMACVREAWGSSDPHFRKIRTSFKSLMADDSIDQLLAIVRGDRTETESIDKLEEAQEREYGKG